MFDWQLLDAAFLIDAGRRQANVGRLGLVRFLCDAHDGGRGRAETEEAEEKEQES